MSQPFQVLYGSETLPLRIGNLALPCYILESGCVFTKSGVQRALGYEGKSEDWLYDFLGSINKFYPVPGVLFEAYERPILFELKQPDGSARILSGIIPETLEMTCITIVNAKRDGYLSVGQLKHAKAAAIVLNYALDHNLHRDIEAATGFVFLKETGKKYLQKITIENNTEPAYQWISILPDVFFEKMLEMHQLTWEDLKHQPMEASRILHEVVFSRISETLLEILRKERPKRVYKTKNSINDSLHPELKVYVAEMLSLLKAANGNWTIFLQLLNRIHPKNTVAEPNLVLHGNSGKPVAELSILDQNLKKGVSLNKTYRKHK